MDSQQTRIRIKALNDTITRNKIIELTFTQAGVPFIRVFGDFPAFTGICRTTDANTLLKVETKNKLRKHGIEVQIPQEVRARRTVFLRQLDRFVGAHSAEEIKEEIEEKNDWAGNVVVTKIGDYTHILKIEFETLEAAERAVSGGVNMFYMFVAPSQISIDEFINILTCFKCYKFEDHLTKDCEVTEARCSECSAVGHRWTECKSQVKKCLNCQGPHRTLAMACPKKKEAIKNKRERNETRRQDVQMRPYSEIVKKTVQECKPSPPTQIVLGNEQSYKIMTCIIHAHVVNLASPGSYERELNRMLSMNGLPTIKAPSDVPSGAFLGAKMA